MGRRLATPAGVKNGQRVSQTGLPFYDDIVKSGAPVSVRAAVASVQKNSDQLAALRKYYPTATPYGTDNFIYRDPKNGNKWTIFNPVGFDKGDLVVGGRLAANAIATIPGAIAGAFTSPVTGPAGPIVGGAVTSTAGGILYDKAVQKLTGAEDTRTLGQQATDAAVETGLNIMIPAAGGKVVKGLRNTFRAGDDAAVNAFRTLGTQAPANASGGTGRRMLTGALDSSWLSSETMATRSAKAVDDIQIGVQNATSVASNVSTKADAGKIVKDAADNYVRGFRTESTRLYDEVDQLIPGDTRVGISNLEKVVDDFRGRYSGDPEVEKLIQSDPMYQKLFDLVDRSRNGLQYQTIKDLRSWIGQEINSGKGKLIDTFGSADTNALWGALTDDMTAAAKFVAGSKGEAAVKAANDFWKQGRQLIDTRIQPVVGAPKDNIPAEKIYDNLMQVSKSTPSALDDWRVVVPDADRTRLGAFTVREMGNAPKAAEGALVDQSGATFNPNRYVSSYNETFNHSNAAPVRSFFFGSDPTLAQTADAAFVASNAMKGAALEKNSSRTFTTSGTAAGVGGVLSGGANWMSGMAADAPLIAGLDVTGTGLSAAAAWNLSQKPLAWALTNPTVERILSRPALTEALPEVTSRLPGWSRGSARTLVGESAQEPSRQELNYDSNAVLAQPQAPVLRINEPDNPFAQFME